MIGADQNLLNSVLQNGSIIALLLLGIRYFVNMNERQAKAADLDKREMVDLLKGVITENTAAFNRLSSNIEKWMAHDQSKR